jgi:hypothetical protein
MAGWEQELAELLSELGVTLETADSQMDRHPTHPTDLTCSREPPLQTLHSDVEQRTEASGALEREADEAADLEDAWLNELRLMRREVDSIVAQVIRLMQRGDLDPSLKEDVMVVLRALRRRASLSQQAALGDESYLEFAAAMLHFCRLVLRLSETAIED